MSQHEDVSPMDRAAEGDAAEQEADVDVRADEEARGPRPVPYDVNEADAAEQERVVELNEDDYR